MTRQDGGEPRLAPHQVSATREILDLLAVRPGIVLADAPGLGKSFVAAAVAARMAARGFAIELTPPASLVEQWRVTLARFSVIARILTHDSLSGDPFVPEAGQKRLLIVDEAHRFRNRATQRYEALARRTVGAKCLFLTATPICNRLDDLYTLLALVAPDDVLTEAGVDSLERVFRERDSERVSIATRLLVIRRGREVLSEELRFGALRREVIRHEVWSGGGEVTAIIDDLRFPLIGRAVREGDSGVSEEAGFKAPLALLRRWLWRRLESSEAALIDSIDRQRRFYERALSSEATGRRLTKSDYLRLFPADEHGAAQEVLFWDVLLPTSTSLGDATTAEIRREVERLNILRQRVLQSPQTKRDAFLALCDATEECMLVFTGSIATARSLHAWCRTRKRSALLTSHQALDAAGRRSTAGALFAALADGALDVLIATDVASEGLDLQAAGVVVHYDLPWSPVRLEQRNGRIHRIGQKRAQVRAIYFVPERQDDESGIVSILSEKTRTIHRFMPQRKRIVGGPLEILDTLRALLRPLVTRDSPMARLFARLQREHLTAPDAAGLLSRRWRLGVELLIADAVDEYLDAGRWAELRDVLRRE